MNTCPSFVARDSRQGSLSLHGLAASFRGTEQPRILARAVVNNTRLRTNGVNANGAAAKVMIVDIGEKGTPWHFGEVQSSLAESPSVKQSSHFQWPH